MNKQKKINLSEEAYDDIPLSVIYKQIIRFMKENGIYTPYLKISLLKMSKKAHHLQWWDELLTFLINFLCFKRTFSYNFLYIINTS